MMVCIIITDILSERSFFDIRLSYNRQQNKPFIKLRNEKDLLRGI